MSYLDARALPFGALGLTQVVGLYTGMAPNPVEVRKHSPADVTFAHDLHSAELIAGSLAIVLGTAQAWHSKSYVPLIYSGLAVGGMVFLYEYLLRQEAPAAVSDGSN